LNEDMTEILIFYALAFIGTPYQWGGDHVHEGFDCSGYVLECLRSVGFDYGDMRSVDLYRKLKDNGHRSGLKRGSILFFGKTQNNITHTAIALNDKVMVESGGGRRGTTVEDSKEFGFGVRIRKIRKDLVGSISLDYSKL